jgi:isopenicillin-N N-acyltransferase-like protein
MAEFHKFKIMRKILITIAICLFTLLISSAQPAAERRLKEITLSGTGYELGFQHGKTLKKEINEIVIKWKENISKNFSKDADQLLTGFFAYAHFTDDVQKYTPELYEEIKGIAAGSGQRFEDILGLNLLDEYWVFLNNAQNSNEGHHCSCIGISAKGGQKAYIAQNMDIEKYCDGFQILMRISRDKNRPEQLLLTFPGCIGLTGLNEAGIGSCENTLLQLKASASGLPVMFIFRKIVNMTNRDELLRFIQQVPHASGQNYVIGIKGEVFDFEASANQVIQYNPENQNGSVCHTNHPLINDDVKPWYAEYNPKLTEKPPGNNSFIRLASVVKNTAAKTSVDESDIKMALRARDDQNNPVCRSLNNNGRSYTFGSVIMSLTGQPFLLITAGPPDESEYKRYDFTEK